MLARIRKSMNEKDEGFTLIELLVVIIIIGILAAIAIPVFLNQRKKGYQASMKSDLRTVANEMETYFTDNQQYNGISNFAVGSSLSGSGSIGSDGVSLSAGNTITLVAAGTNGYCLKAVSSKSSGVTYYYDSQNGGLQPASSTGCIATSY
jgi:prepilin-type N-terminal cleavage/methylation domain-containing protein